ncbi:MAG: TadE/TadG family type IV pilus assembly protein [Chloroflexota bacterium]
MLSQKTRNAQGQALTEFALILVVVLLAIFIIMEASRILWAWVTLQNAAREGARYATTGSFEPEFSDQPDPRVASIKDLVHRRLLPLPLNEEPDALFEDDYYYLIEVYGVDLNNQLQPEFAGLPGKPVVVRVTYRVPVIAPLLSAIAQSVPVFGQVVMNNEMFGQQGNAGQGAGLPPALPPVPTAGVTPSPTPTATATGTNTPGPSPTPTDTATPGPSPTPSDTPTITPTPTPIPCNVRFDSDLIDGMTYVAVTGDLDTTVTVINLTTGATLGAATIDQAAVGHQCPGLVQVSPLNSPLVVGDLILVDSSDGTFDVTIVLAGTATPTPTPTATLTPSPTPSDTPTPTLTPTPAAPYVQVAPDCDNDPDVEVVVSGANWPTGDAINLFWDDGLQSIIPSGHAGSFQQTWTFAGLATGDHEVAAYAGSNSDTAIFSFPCADYTPPAPTPTPTSTPRPADLLIVGLPQLISTPPIYEYLPLDFQVVISNTGDVDVNEQFWLDIYFDPGLVLSYTIPLSYSSGFMGISALPARSSQVYTITSDLGFSGGYSTHLVYGMVDSLEEIGESDEFNNIAGPAQIDDVLPGYTPTPTPTSAGTESISGIVRSRYSIWVPQPRAEVRLVDEATSLVIATTESDQDGYYEFLNVAAGTYTVISCVATDNGTFSGLRTGIIVPPSNPFVDVYMLPGVCP